KPPPRSEGRSIPTRTAAAKLLICGDLTRERGTPMGLARYCAGARGSDPIGEVDPGNDPNAARQFRMRTVPRRESGIVKGNAFPISQDQSPPLTVPAQNGPAQNAPARNSPEGDSNLLDALPAAVYTTDAAGIVTFCNRAAAELAGREPRIGEDRW